MARIQSEPTFHQFTRLPIELQLKIWTYSLPSPRIIDIIAISTDERFTFYDIPPAHSTTGVNSPSARWVRSFTDHVRGSTRNPLPLLLSINRDTRSYCLSKWKFLKWVDAMPRTWGKSRHGRRPWRFLPPQMQDDGQESMFYAPVPTGWNYVLVNPAIDILFLADPRITQTISSLSVLVRWLDAGMIGSVRNLAIQYDSWRKDRTFKHLGLLLKFTSLERLWVCFVADVEMGNQGWLGAVGVEQNEEGYLGEVKEHVLGDVEELGRNNPGWRKPLVKIVRDRGALVKEWIE